MPLYWELKTLSREVSCGKITLKSLLLRGWAFCGWIRMYWNEHIIFVYISYCIFMLLYDLCKHQDFNFSNLDRFGKAQKLESSSDLDVVVSAVQKELVADTSLTTLHCKALQEFLQKPDLDKAAVEKYWKWPWAAFPNDVLVFRRFWEVTKEKVISIWCVYKCFEKQLWYARVCLCVEREGFFEKEFAG